LDEASPIRQRLAASIRSRNHYALNAERYILERIGEKIEKDVVAFT